MPALNPIFTALDIGDAMITKLNADTYIRAAIVKSDGTTFNPVLDDDPTAVSSDTNIQLVFTLATEGEGDATMGGPSGGTAELKTTFAVMAYQWQGDNRDRQVKRNLIKVTGIVRQALMRYRQGPPVQGTLPPLLWYNASFHKGAQSAVSTYYTGRNERFSVTLVDLYSRLPFG